MWRWWRLASEGRARLDADGLQKARKACAGSSRPRRTVCRQRTSNCCATAARKSAWPPGKPSENGYIERLIRTMEEEVYRSDYGQTIGEAREQLGYFIDVVYNQLRPTAHWTTRRRQNLRQLGYKESALKSSAMAVSKKTGPLHSPPGPLSESSERGRHRQVRVRHARKANYREHRERRDVPRRQCNFRASHGIGPRDVGVGGVGGGLEI